MEIIWFLVHKMGGHSKFQNYLITFILISFERRHSKKTKKGSLNFLAQKVPKIFLFEVNKMPRFMEKFVSLFSQTQWHH